MSVTSGFFNSLNGDRRYNAEQISSIFDGIINDGVFSSIGTAFGVRADVGNIITVGTGRAWFNSTWLLNDAILPITSEESEILLDRYDAVVIEINHSDSVRAGTIKIIKGTPSSNPQKPSMISTKDVHQYPLAYIMRKAGAGEITQADITNMIGTSNCPYITGILEVQNIDNIVAQWQEQWKIWFSEKTTIGDNLMSQWEKSWDQWFIEETTSSDEQMSQWMNEHQAEFNMWFDIMKDVVSSIGNGELLLKVQRLLEDLYRTATNTDIDNIIGERYVDDENECGIFETGTDQDVDEIIGNTYVDIESPEEDIVDETEIQAVIDSLFK